MIPFCVLCSSYIPKKAILAKKGGQLNCSLFLETFTLKQNRMEMLTLKKKVPMLAGVLAVGLVTSLFAPNGEAKAAAKYPESPSIMVILINKDSPH